MRGSVVGHRFVRLCRQSGRRDRVVLFLVHLGWVDWLIAIQSEMLA